MFELPVRPIWAAILALAASPAMPAQAQEQPPAPPPIAVAPPPAAGAAPIVSADPDHPAFDDLITAITEAVDQDAAYNAMAVTIAREYAKVPEIAALEKIKPGLIDAVVRSMQPVMKTIGNRVQRDYRPRSRAVLARKLMPAEAEDIAAFYRSPLGRKLVGSASRRTTMDNTLTGIADHIAAGKDPNSIVVESTAVQKDILGTASSAVGALTSDELAELGRLALEKPALLKLNSMIGDMIILQTAMANEQPNAEELAALEAAVTTAMTRHMGS